MKREEALKILEQEDLDTPKQAILTGLQILAKYDDDMVFSFDHDQMWISNFDETIKKMSKEEVQKMAECGFFEDCESWSHF